MKQWTMKTAKSWAAGMIAGWWVVVASAQPMTTNGYTFSPNRAVPDGNPTGLALATNLSGMTDFIANVTVSLNISGGFNGDLYAYTLGRPAALPCC